MADKLDMSISLTRFDNYEAYELEESKKVDKALVELVVELLNIVVFKSDDSLDVKEKKKKLGQLKISVYEKLQKLALGLENTESPINQEIIKMYVSYTIKYSSKLFGLKKNKNKPEFIHTLNIKKDKQGKYDLSVELVEGNVFTLNNLNSLLSIINSKIINSSFVIKIETR